MRKYLIVLIFGFLQTAIHFGALSQSLSKPSKLLPSVGSLKNLYLVDSDNFIYRSSQPDYNDFKMLQEKYKINSILKLNGEKPEPYGNLIFNLVVVPMTWTDITEQQVVSALRELIDSPKPLLVHCSAGVDRTGIIIAFYRVLMNNWTKQQAFDEMKNTLGFSTGYLHDKNAESSKLLKYFCKANVSSLKNKVLNTRINLENYFKSPVEVSGLPVYNSRFIVTEKKLKKID